MPKMVIQLIKVKASRGYRYSLVVAHFSLMQRSWVPMPTSRGGVKSDMQSHEFNQVNLPENYQEYPRSENLNKIQNKH